MGEEQSSQTKYEHLLNQVFGNFMEQRLLSSTLRNSYLQQIAARDKCCQTERYQQAQEKFKRDIAFFQKSPLADTSTQVLSG